MSIRFERGFSGALFGVLVALAASSPASAGPVGLARAQITGASASPSDVHWRPYRHHHHHQHYPRGS